MPRFVILHHETPPGYERPTHWDFMLEVGNVLRTWSLPEPPDAAASQEVEALADHRAAYLTFEGPLSGDRGSVTRWDAGTYEIEEDDVETSGCGSLVVRLSGGSMSGRVELTPLAAVSARTDGAEEAAEEGVAKEDTAGQRWRFCWSAD